MIMVVAKLYNILVQLPIILHTLGNHYLQSVHWLQIKFTSAIMVSACALRCAAF